MTPEEKSRKEILDSLEKLTEDIMKKMQSTLDYAALECLERATNEISNLYKKNPFFMDVKLIRKVLENIFMSNLDLIMHLQKNKILSIIETIHMVMVKNGKEIEIPEIEKDGTLH